MNFEKSMRPGNLSLLKNIEDIKHFIQYTIYLYLPIYMTNTFYHDDQSRGGRREDGGFRRYLGVMRDNASRIEKWGLLSQCKPKIRAANVNAHRIRPVSTTVPPDFLLIVLPNI